MPFVENEVARLVRLPPGVFALFVGRSVVVTAIMDGVDVYAVEPLFPLSADDLRTLGRTADRARVRMKVLGAQLEAMQAVYVDMSGPAGGDGSSSE